MAIQNRRGIYDNFDPTQLLPGEWAVVLSGDSNATNGTSVYMCFAAGVVKRMTTYEDMATEIDAKTADIIQAAVVALAEEVAHINAEALPDMAANQRGIAKLGSGLKMASSTLSVDTTSTGVIPQSEKAAAGGVAELDENGIVISSQLPSYVDDVVEGATVSDFPATGETGKIYVATSTNLSYRWSGSGYVEISPSLALGETSSTAYRGDRGAAAYLHAVTNKGIQLAKKLYKLATNAEGHVTAGEEVTGSDIATLVSGQALTPASVAATGAIQGNSISDGVGTLDEVRESVSSKIGTVRVEIANNDRSTILTALTNNNSLIPSQKLVCVEFYLPAWGQVTQAALVCKVSNNYGGGYCFGYYEARGSLFLDSGTWISS